MLLHKITSIKVVLYSSFAYCILILYTLLVGMCFCTLDFCSDYFEFDAQISTSFSRGQNERYFEIAVFYVSYVCF